MTDELLNMAETRAVPLGIRKRLLSCCWLPVGKEGRRWRGWGEGCGRGRRPRGVVVRNQQGLANAISPTCHSQSGWRKACGHYNNGWVYGLRESRENTWFQHIFWSSEPHPWYALSGWPQNWSDSKNHDLLRDGSMWIPYCTQPTLTLGFGDFIFGR